MFNYQVILDKLQQASLSDSWEEMVEAAQAIDQLDDLSIDFQVEKALQEQAELFPIAKLPKAARKLRHAIYLLR